MKKVVALKLLVLLFHMPTNSVLAQESSESEGPLKKTASEAVQEIVNLAHAAFDFSGGVLVARNDEIIAMATAGTTEGKTPTAIDKDTLFEIGSCTKPFTAIAVMQLVERGKVDLDKSIAEYLPGVPENCREITVRHLLQHTSGIPGTNSRGHGTKLERVLPLFLAGGPKKKPGTHFEYWNQGYSLLSEIVARVSNVSYTEYCRKKIFEPAGMTNTKFTGDCAADGDTVATGLSSYGKPRMALEHPYGEYGYQYRGMGGIVTSLNDLWKWERALRTEKLINKKSMETMRDPGNFGYGLGWNVKKNSDRSIIQKHTGSVRGFVCGLWRYPASESCIFVLTNRDNAMPMELVASGCQKVLNGNLAPFALPKPLEDSLQRSISGEYVDSKSRKMTVSCKNGVTSAKIFWGGPVSNGLLAQANDETVNFYLAKSLSPLTFKIDAPVKVNRKNNGSVRSLILEVNESKLIFTKK